MTKGLLGLVFLFLMLGAALTAPLDEQGCPVQPDVAAEAPGQPPVPDISGMNLGQSLGESVSPDKMAALPPRNWGQFNQMVEELAETGEVVPAPETAEETPQANANWPDGTGLKGPSYLNDCATE